MESPSYYDIYDTIDLESGFSSKTITKSPKQTHISNTRIRRKITSSIFCEPYEFEEEPQYFLDSCFLCKKPLSRNKDIFMYRGDTPFCSEECRREQMEIDEAKEKGRKSQASNPSSTKRPHSSQQKQNSQGIPVWAW